MIRKYKGDGKPHTAQATIPYEAMYPDGVCRLTKNTFSKCIAFEDISYQLAQPDTKTAIFEHLCDLYNYVDASMLPYKSLCFTGMKDSHGLYAVIGKDENRDKEVRRPRASIRRQLSETKQAQAPQKAPARTKKNELEV